MSAPSWIDEIRQRYLADEGNVYLLHGALGARWSWDGDDVDTVGALTRFLSRTRQVVGILRPGEAVRFPNFEDTGRFERLISAQEILQGKRLRRDAASVEDQLGLVWAAMAGSGADQGWILVDAQVAFPGHRKREEPLGAGAPPFAQWAAALKATNHVVFLLAADPAALRPEIAASAVPVHLAPARAAPPAPAADPVRHARTAAEAEIEAFLNARSSEPQPEAQGAQAAEAPSLAAPSARPADGGLPEELAEELSAALQLTVPAHPVSTWPARLPVLDAVARVLAARSGGSPSTWSVDDEGRAVAGDPAGEALLARWRGDIALDASAGMLLKEIAVPEGAERVEGPVALHETAIRALSRRVAKLLG